MNELQPITVGPTAALEAMPPKPRRTALGRAPEVVHARLGAMPAIAAVGLPAPLIAALKHLASLHNPDFYKKKQKMCYSTFGAPRFVMCFDASEADWLRIPRGLADEVTKLFGSAGGELRVEDGLPTHEPITARFAAELTPVQAKAVDAMTQHPTGVLVAPPGEVRSWARKNGHPVPDRGRLRSRHLGRLARSPSDLFRHPSRASWNYGSRRCRYPQ